MKPLCSGINVSIKAGSNARTSPDLPNQQKRLTGRSRLVDQLQFKDKELWPAPQIEAENEPILAVDDRPRPAGFSPISPFWKDRADFAGTYDDEWLAQRHPLLPTDFDFSFWQAAPRDQVIEPWLTGSERFELHRLLPKIEALHGYLPGITLGVELDRGTGPSRGAMKLDGIHFDLRPGVGRVFLTWRIGFPWAKRIGVPALHAFSSTAETV